MTRDQARPPDAAQGGWTPGNVGRFENGEAIG